MNQSPNSPYLKEACVETVEGAVQAMQHGADRLELCADLALDGLTPSPALVQAVLAQVNIPIRVMIRPRGGDFCYSVQELAKMKEDIQAYKNTGVQGFVSGVLTEEGIIAITALQELAAECYPLPLIFHKAIDQTPDLLQATRVLKNLPGVTGILSSGGEATAEEGAPILRQMIALAKEDIEVVAAGKITKENLEELHQIIGAKEYHGRRIV